MACVLCGHLVDTSLPGTIGPGPTIEHQPPVRAIVAAARDWRQAVDMVASPTTWAGIAHRRCQARQGQRATAAINRARNEQRRTVGGSRVW